MTLLAADLGAVVEYTWWAQRRGFIRNTLKAGLCDLIAGVPTGMEMLATTRPYYRSGYVFMAAGGRAPRSGRSTIRSCGSFGSACR